MYKLSSQLAYWKKLASDYYGQSEYRKEKEKYTETELNILSSLTDDLNSTELLIYKTKSQISHLESHIATSHAQLESLKYRSKRRYDIHSITCIHSLSRESPYPKTRIERFAVPDKYVPWEVMWQHYDPPTFTMTKDEFPSNQRPYVDEDLLVLQQNEIQKSELPSFMWNMETVDSTGIYQNRNTWTTDVNGRRIQYKLDQHDVPKNPMGRTGLRGKGALPRWGPNHNVYVVITRWQQEKSESSDPALLETSDNLEFVETYYLRKTNISLPGGFVWLENQYESIRSIFIQNEQSEPWTSTEDMIKFFQEHAVGVAEPDKNEQFKTEKVFRGYMDDQLNTDNAWKEVELWHIHYNTLTDLDTKFKMDVKWRLLCDDVFIQLPLGQRFLLQRAIKDLKTKFA
ncbi:ADP-ribose pyrophosphatase, mitochondrial-like [Uloborus diversus]|uniref:ADP-ribose pyrophosphatase, mitochondrial-like n=1 Tax=Uloborus diversus TaxID=327109 RepID=UPI00240A435F|nr:ADP-ribose pyrophosphatase, mitochondrial-like [Uloborus diversus]XP_054711631.1 ADP-ribose pyrophosphatase, mitochondrial-like [Uloborus diversus]